jgi:peptidoglycan/xylan/chitin deacetylase (PgdA/CDA1 family)
MRLPVLMYHHVGPPRAGACPSLTVAPDRFERQMSWLARNGYVGIRPSDWLAHRAGRSLPSRSVLITFDDGYADIVQHAFPVLQRHDFGAVVFVVTQRVAGASDWDWIDGWIPHPLMTAGQIREWAARGIEFGAHTRTHPDLTRLAEADLDAEIAGSRDELAAITGEEVTSFAYPYGRVDDRAHRRVSQAFRLALTCLEGVNTRSTDVHRMHRTMVQPGESALGVACRVRLGRYPVDAWRARLRLRSRLRRLARVHW